MGWFHFHQFCVIVVVFLTLLAEGISASAFISDCIFSGDALTGRSLLQAKKSCPVNFEIQNYTIITSQCKAPDYPANLCCPAFKHFACPFAEYLNDLTTDCASSMFSNINDHGYQPGLFATCVEGQEIKCPAQPPSDADNTNGSLMTSKSSPSVHIRAGASLVLLLRLL